MVEGLQESAGLPPNSDDLLARGDALLQQLSREAEAARAEARRAELEQVLHDARLRGNSSQLQAWLEQYDRIRGSEPPACERKSQPNSHQHAEALFASVPLASPGITSPVSWDDFLPAARQRLEARAQRLLSGVESQRGSEMEGESRGPSASKSNQLGGQPGACARALNRELLNEPPKQTQEQNKKQLPFSRWRGLSASVLLHIGLVVLLALMTVKLPPAPANLAFDSAVSQAAATFELAESFEVAAPSEVPETVSTPDMSVDLPDNLSDVKSTLTPVVGASVVSSSRTSAALAALTMESSGPTAVRMDSSFFGAAAVGNCFCYVIDSSGSMRGGAWEAAKAELQHSLSKLKESQRFYIIFFHNEVQAIPAPGEREPAPNALYATQENLEHARQWIDTIRVDRGAPPTAALKIAVELEPDAVFLLTDGVTKVDVPKALRELNRVSDLIHGEQVKVPIHAIAYYSLEGEPMMRQVAEENGGQFIYVPDPRKLQR